MQFTNPTAEIFVPDGTPLSDALARTTHIAIAAHQYDIEIMAYRGIIECFGVDDRWFTGVVVTNGAGSPRDDLYASCSDEQMQKVRRVEQIKAAFVGEYAAQALLNFTSAAVKDGGNRDVVEDIKKLLRTANPQVVYTHNFADKHDTHVGVALKTIQAVREMDASDRPQKVYGCEVWRDLDWMTDTDKVGFDVSAHPNIAAAVLGVFDSQICGGKRYDLATFGRRTAHATYFASHGTDEVAALNFAMDLTPLIEDPTLDVADYALGYIDRFRNEVAGRIAKLR
jgi:LmbE family N-acetylglucosaminyl deacetylase